MTFLRFLPEYGSSAGRCGGDGPCAASDGDHAGLHHLTQAAHDQVLEKLCAALNETQTVFPGTELTLIFKIGSSQFPPGQEV